MSRGRRRAGRDYLAIIADLNPPAQSALSIFEEFDPEQAIAETLAALDGLGSDTAGLLFLTFVLSTLETTERERGAAGRAVALLAVYIAGFACAVRRTGTPSSSATNIAVERQPQTTINVY